MTQEHYELNGYRIYLTKQAGKAMGGLYEIAVESKELPRFDNTLEMWVVEARNTFDNGRTSYLLSKESVLSIEHYLRVVKDEQEDNEAIFTNIAEA